MPFVIPGSVTAPTLSAYMTDVQRLLHDSTYRYWSQQELTDYINKGRKIVAALTGCTRILTPVDITAATTQDGATYSFDTLISGRRVIDVLDILLQYSTSTVYQLKFLPIETAVRTGLWQIQSAGTPSHYTIHNRSVIILRWPGIDYLGSTFDCAVEPDLLDLGAGTTNNKDMSATDNDLIFPDTECVGFYAAYLAKLKDQRRAEAEAFLVDFQRNVSRSIGTAYTRRLINR